MHPIFTKQKNPSRNRQPAVKIPQLAVVNSRAVVNGWTGGVGVELQRVVSIYIHIQPLKKITHSRSLSGTARKPSVYSGASTPPVPIPGLHL